MASFYPNWRILASVFAAGALIIGAYLLARGVASPPVAQASTETALLQQIATRDSTGDGLPDWEKSLYGIPVNASTTDYFHLGMTDGEAVAKGLIVPKAATPASPVSTPPSTDPTVIAGVPAAADGTLTDAFARDFFTVYLQAQESNGGAELSQDQVSSLADQVVATLSSSIAPAADYKSSAEIKVSGTGADALASYAVAAENVFRAHAANLPKSELDYLQDALNGDTSAIDSLQKIAKSYQDTAAGLAALPVPQEAASEHLALVNSLAREGGIVSDFARVNADPMASMLALEELSPTVKALFGSFQNIASLYASENATPLPGAPGAYFVNLISDAKAAQTSP